MFITGNALGICPNGLANGARFSTLDVDNDPYKTSCAIKYKGAWWYVWCHCSNLNGQYLAGHHSTSGDGIEWVPFHGYKYSLKTVKMMVKKQ